jgi:hypothetical protein
VLEIAREGIFFTELPLNWLFQGSSQEAKSRKILSLLKGRDIGHLVWELKEILKK